ncbi:molybdate transport system substrate-binding protein [Actinoplanes lutulentus]|uniref:Molybdate transport system substrate-binding protein n=1 Tax=Actinoplanes lutulentus TaxID=1287878 RepID=A0A327ZIY7_9ACTN|nr:substrate-binding domain-containing protein [Actinoplanes lutulentus]MBB2942602.1 molybdate transport system substrate-binding protein [Actinoplanes lutulentus]RAK38183.1 molybdate transport system substrate-binding protein [Actinoplanes lutulentus]
MTVKILLMAVLALGGCASPAVESEGDEGIGGVPATSLAPEATGEITVLASDTLSEAFDLIRDGFQARNPRAFVVMAYTSNESLTRQIAGGEPPDVVATDDAAALRGVSSEKATFGSGRLTVAALDESPAAELFVDYLSDASAQRALIDTGVLRP